MVFDVMAQSKNRWLAMVNMVKNLSGALPLPSSQVGL